MPIAVEVIENKIFSLRGHRVMLDRDLAELYGVSTKALNQAVKRNRARFPDDFTFQLKRNEALVVFSLRSQIVTLKRGEHVKYLPFVFTEHGAIMLANILKSSAAINASIQVVRAFIHLRRSVLNQEAILRQLKELEAKTGKHDSELRKILEILHILLEPPALPPSPKRQMGFSHEDEK